MELSREMILKGVAAKLDALEKLSIFYAAVAVTIETMRERIDGLPEAVKTEKHSALREKLEHCHKRALLVLNGLKRASNEYGRCALRVS